MLKKFRKKMMLPLFAVILFLSNISVLEVHAGKTLDKIWDYTIHVTPYSDGSLYMEYHIEWEVLDSTSEGPLSWVKIGIPNKHVEDINALSDNIDKIRYYRDGGDYVRIDLDRNYYAGEVVEFDFSIHQHRMYETEGNNRVYTFTPGWFDDIYVDYMCINWDMENVSSASGDYFEDGDVYCWVSELSKGQKYTVRLTYPDSAFSGPDDSNVRSSDSGDSILIVAMVILPVAVAILIVFCTKMGTKDSYTKHSGMGYVYRPVSHTGGRRSGGGCA